MMFRAICVKTPYNERNGLAYLIPAYGETRPEGPLPSFPGPNWTVTDNEYDGCRYWAVSYLDTAI